MTARKKGKIKGIMNKNQRKQLEALEPKPKPKVKKPSGVFIWPK